MQNINLNNLATKDDLGETKVELSGKIDKVDKKVDKAFWYLDSKIDSRVDKLEENMNKKFDEVAESADKQIKLLTKIDQELVAHSKSYQDHGVKLDDHEKRIISLELNPAV